MATSFHIHMDVTTLLNMEDAELMETVNHPDGVEGARAELKDMLNEGMTCLTVGDCDNKKDNGACGGHPVSDSPIEAAVTENVTTEYVAWCGECEAELKRWEDELTSFELTCSTCGKVNSVNNEY